MASVCEESLESIGKAYMYFLNKNKQITDICNLPEMLNALTPETYQLML